jgi:GMP synthase-like glutamine amidotransferase
MDAHIFHWIVVIRRIAQIIPVPLLLLAWVWSFQLPASKDKQFRVTLLIVASISHAWALLPEQFIGPPDSGIRRSIINMNIVVMLICLGASLLPRGKGKIFLIIAALLTTCFWAITGTINSMFR